MNICRICLCNKPRKNISELKFVDDQRIHTYEDIIKFCLDIQVTEGYQVTTKLCTKCFKKIIQFHQFKTLALSTDAYLFNLNSQSLKNYLFENHVKDDTFDVSDWQGTGAEAYDESVVKESLEPTDLHLVENSPHPSYNQVVDEIACQVKEESIQEDLNVLENELLDDSNITYQIVKSEEIETTTSKRTKTKVSKLKRKQYKKKYRENKALEVCPQCGKQVKNLKEHSVTHMSYEQRKKFKCDLCHKVFQTIQGKYRHVRVHSDDAKKQCDICKTEVLYLKEHMKAAHQPEARRFPCVSCNQRFLSQGELNAHVSVHTNDKPFQCDQCGNSFRTNQLMSMHKRRVHLKEKCFQCDICHRSFFKKERLKEHIRTHTHEKPYQCPDCDHAFVSSSSLKNHRFVHSKESFKCTKCDVSFSRPRYLQAHIRNHMKVKRYPCQYCPVAFYRSDHRNRHQITAHTKKKAKASAKSPTI